MKANPVVIAAVSAVALTALTFVLAARGLGALISWIDGLPVAAQELLRAACLIVPGLALVALALRNRRGKATSDAGRPGGDADA